MRQSGKRNRKEEQNGMEKTYSLSKEKKVCRAYFQRKFHINQIYNFSSENSIFFN
jgi:hypothetical protein